MKFKVNVEQKHIRAGAKGDLKFCPIALALREQLPSFMLEDDIPIRVLSDYAEIGEFRVSLPRAAGRFIERFDGCKDVQPFTFYL